MKNPSKTKQGSDYYKKLPEEIVKDIQETCEVKCVEIRGVTFEVYPEVYPSERFRSTYFMLDQLCPLFAGKTVCDMGCGIGLIGLFALRNGAKRVVQADINAQAVLNSRANAHFQGLNISQIRVYESDCFSAVPRQAFDMLVFNVPFHSEPYDIQNDLEKAFHDPDFQTLKMFLDQSFDYTHSDSEIYITFSNKGDVAGLERIFDSYPFQWELWRVANQEADYDNRLYRIWF